jgi:gluconate 2-dehydrogenase gamma chain
MAYPSRRQVLACGAAFLAMAASRAGAVMVKGNLPWEPGRAAPPPLVTFGGWLFFTPTEAAAIEALVDRLIPADAQTPGGKDVGCAVFIDRQLAGPYGRAEGSYMSGPQLPLTPAQQYRQALAALDHFSRATYGGAAVVQLSDAQRDELLGGLEKDEVHLEGADGRGFFALLLKDTKQGFFADPIYGGNKDMAAWKMIGFPGARYDYRDWVERHNERYPLPPIGINTHPNWGR